MDREPWVVGQRVRNEVEPSLGLGIVRRMVSLRNVEVFFPAAQEMRCYSVANAPLRRFHLHIGQQATGRDGRTFRVERVDLKDGLLTYWAGGIPLPESELSDGCSSGGAVDALLEGELAHFEAFDLRDQSWQMRAVALQSPARGLMGSRVTLLPHQLAIAHQVAARDFPRVLLADEVGLGKTIEACLIFSALRALGRANRVLILTPPSLVHQWLTELYRRFNELFRVAHSEWIALTDEEEELAETRGEDEGNPFEDSPRIIAPLDWLCNPARLHQALEVDWDLVIVDEAHHLSWSPVPEEVSPQYRCLEALSKVSKGLLLLTATPLRQGLETEYALLHLVEPERFAHFDKFQEEQRHLKEVADVAKRLSEDDPSAPEAIRQLFPADKALHLALDNKGEALNQLVDRHGTGRVLVRNRRERLGGFPGRQLHSYPLPCPPSWKGELAWPEVRDLARLISREIETEHKPDLKSDPRWQWVLSFVRSLGGEKVVIMAVTAKAVLRLEKFFRAESGLKVALFHEKLSLVERDRQAAYFANDDGAQVLLSSEIGGEGRNFQFCHHLVLFDIPAHPDALEQRIGRLDRIGQTHTIQVHVPYVEATPCEALFRWHEALGVFADPLGGGEHIIEALGLDLFDTLQQYPKLKQVDKRDKLLGSLLKKTQRELDDYRNVVQQNVDFLVDLNSFHQDIGQRLVEEIKDFDVARLENVVSQLLEYFGVTEDDLADPKIRKLKPGHLMKVDPFPGLRSDGCLVTYDRDYALAREDLQFLSSDHPLVEGTLGLLLDQAEGRACVALWPGAEEQNLWVQFLFVLEAAGPQGLELSRYLPPTPVAVTLDIKGRRRLEPVGRLQGLGPQVWARLSVPMRDRLPRMLEQAERKAEADLRQLLQDARSHAAELLGLEQQRLLELFALGTVSQREVDAHRRKQEATCLALAEARVALDAVRVIVLDPRPAT